MSTPTEKKRIVILGGGFGGINTFLELHKRFHKDKSVEIFLVNKTNYFLFTPLLHEVATGGISRGNVIEPIRKILDCCLQDLYVGTVKNISLKEKKIETSVGTLSFDYLVLALGAETQYFGTPGSEKYSFALKTHDDAIRLKNRFVEAMEAATKEPDPKKRKELLHFVVVGGGPTGVELAAEMAELFYKTFKNYYPKELLREIQITLIQRDVALIPMFSKTLQKKALTSLQKLGVTVRTETVVKSVSPNAITLGNGDTLLTRTTIWVAGVGPATIPFDEEISKNARGCILVNEHLQVAHHENVFVLGDMACFLNKDSKPLPALAQVAVKQSPIVAKNIIALIDGRPLQTMKYHHGGSLISLGQWDAAGDIGPFHLGGAFVWWLWRTIYLSKMISRRKKIKVAVDWTINLFSPRDISQF